MITCHVMSEAEDIGLVLKRLRESAGLSQRQLADKLNVQQPAVARWEKGGVNMPVNRIEDILKQFGYGIEYDLRAVPMNVALNDGLPIRLVRRRSKALAAHPATARVRSGTYDFAVNNEAPWSVDMWDVASKRRLPGAVAVYPERIDEIVPHPDGVLIRFGRSVGKITTNAKRHGDGNLVFTYSIADRRDLELAGVDRDPVWSTSKSRLPS